ncbi:S24 family peptidase [Asaia spathodeae]
MCENANMEDTLEEARKFVRNAMAQTGLDATNLARRAKLAPSTLTRLLNGDSKNAPGFKTLSKIAAIAEVPMPGTMSQAAHKKLVKLYGYAGAGDLVFPDYAQDADDLVEAPLWAGEHLCALKVKGDSMYPAYWAGDIVFFNMEPGQQEAIDYSAESVVKLPSGELYIKQLQRGSCAGLYNLISYNSPPIVDSHIEWARPVLFVDRRNREKK